MRRFEELTLDQQRDVYDSLNTLSQYQMDSQAESDLDDTFGTVDICGLTYSAVQALKDVDPIAFREMLANDVDSMGYVSIRYSGNDYYAEESDLDDAIQEVLNEEEEA